MPKLSLQIHPSIRIQGEPTQFEGEYTEKTIIECMKEVVKESSPVVELLFQEGKLRSGLLFLSGKTELKSLGLLETILDNDVHIRVVPILHGG